jgi:hypothetical protein
MGRCGGFTTRKILNAWNLLFHLLGEDTLKGRSGKGKIVILVVWKAEN